VDTITSPLLCDTPDPTPPSVIPDVRATPLARVTPDPAALRRILPATGTRAVPVAAFNASL
jgi:FXSXX-COOH protein